MGSGAAALRPPAPVSGQGSMVAKGTAGTTAGRLPAGRAQRTRPAPARPAPSVARIAAPGKLAAAPGRHVHRRFGRPVQVVHLDPEQAAHALRRSGIDHLLIRTDRPYVHAVRGFFESRGLLGRRER